MIKRKLELSALSKVSLSTRQDDFVVLHVRNQYDTPMEMVFKTEFLTLLDEKYRAMTSRSLQVEFADEIDFKVGWMACCSLHSLPTVSLPANNCVMFRRYR